MTVYGANMKAQSGRPIGGRDCKKSIFWYSVEVLFLAVSQLFTGIIFVL